MLYIGNMKSMFKPSQLILVCRFDDIYDLVLVFKDGKTKISREESFKRSVADFMDENGLLCMDLLEDAVLKLHRSLATDKKDN